MFTATNPRRWGPGDGPWPAEVSVIDLSPFDFVDFGCSSGGSMAYAKRTFGGDVGLGLDIDPEKVKKAREDGFHAELADATNPSQFLGQVRFSILSHFLEHLPDFRAVGRAINTALSISTDFVFIRQPWFDSDPALFRMGCKMYWSDWSGHPMPLTSLQMHRALRSHLGSTRVRMFGRTPISSTDSDCVVPLSAPVNSSKYDPSLHGPKPVVDLEAFQELVVLIEKRETEAPNGLTCIFDNQPIFQPEPS